MLLFIRWKLPQSVHVIRVFTLFKQKETTETLWVCFFFGGDSINFFAACVYNKILFVGFKLGIE